MSNQELCHHYAWAYPNVEMDKDPLFGWAYPLVHQFIGLVSNHNNRKIDPTKAREYLNRAFQNTRNYNLQSAMEYYQDDQ